MELSDERVLLSIRNESARHRRLFATSDDGSTRWAVRYQSDLFEPNCMASLARCSERLLHVARARPAAATRDWDGRTAPDQPGAASHASPLVRERFTVRLSRDEGHTWPVALVVGLVISSLVGTDFDMALYRLRA